MRVKELLDVPDLRLRLTGRNLSCLDDQVDFFLALRIR